MGYEILVGLVAAVAAAVTAYLNQCSKDTRPPLETTEIDTGGTVSPPWKK